MRYNILILFTFILLSNSVFGQSRGISSGEIKFGKPIKITGLIQKKLDSLSDYMLYNPLATIVVTGYGTFSKLHLQDSWENVNATIEFESERHGIARERFIFQYGENGIAGLVKFRLAKKGEEGPVNVAPPHPYLRRH